MIDEPLNTIYHPDLALGTSDPSFCVGPGRQSHRRAVGGLCLQSLSRIGASDRLAARGAHCGVSRHVGHL